ncbi:D-tyrosyl-tRNA(Tyr) deacylase [Candidatus Bathyarchaeota archaeon]|nr:D-tyrosyl-tRNA(Tyr) deacylase [Candidatus Bathyarchaeota archaeon]
MILIAASTKDLASVNIAKKILDNYPFKQIKETVYSTEVSGQKVELVMLDEELVYAQNIIASCSSLDLVIFISRHSSLSGTPTLSVHTPGNLGAADLGGITRKVSIAPANAMKAALNTMAQLVEEKHLNYKVSYECTHHGPSLDVPAMFAELGSTSKEWKDLEAAEVVAHAAMKAVADFDKQTSKAVLGIGGPHYNEKFTRMALEEDIAFGHIVPKYAASKIDEAVLRHCIERTLEKVKFAVLDWKGIKGEDKPNVVELLNKVGLEFQKV